MMSMSDDDQVALATAYCLDAQADGELGTLRDARLDSGELSVSHQLKRPTA
jgi:hypothetical protein